MVKKRTVIFAALVIFIWAFLATCFAAYYYTERLILENQLSKRQQTLNALVKSYNDSVTRRNMLSSEYGSLLGSYQYFALFGWFSGENRSSCLEKYELLLLSLKGNYSMVLENSLELNKTYTILLDEFRVLKENQDEVTVEDFGKLLNDFYKLFSALATKGLENTVSAAGEIQVSLCINYTKIGGSLEWHNISIPLGSNLFELTRKVAGNVEYEYYPTMEPGHILIKSIGGHTEDWLWYYWDKNANCWVWGPVGCDAWILENEGIYKWDVYS